MSSKDRRPPPYTPKAAAPAPPPAPPTCKTCRHWHAGASDGRAAPEGAGECREGPPGVQIAIGPVYGYRLTLGDLPACGRYAPRD